MKNAMKARPLNDAQLLVLQVVEGDYNKQEIEELHKLLLDFNYRKVQQHLDATVTEKNYSKGDFENMLTGHLRKTR